MRKAWLVAAVVAWTLLVLGGMAFLLVFRVTPGQAGRAPGAWPVGTTVTRSADRATLLMFARPDCLCTRASIGELAMLVSSFEGSPDIVVLLRRPAGDPGDLRATEYARRAAELPGVRVIEDVDGVEMARFGVRTSGHVVVYAVDGRLLFTGGITGGRGHSGDNAGRALAARALRGEHSGPSLESPAYGCPLDAAPAHSEGETR